MKNRMQHGKLGRKSKVGGVCLAAMLAVAAFPAPAQDIADFEDPLAQIRAQIQQVEPAQTTESAVEEKAALASVASGNAAATTPDVKDPLARISERFGLPVLGLVALAGLALLALLLGAIGRRGRAGAARTAKWYARKTQRHAQSGLARCRPTERDQDAFDLTEDDIHTEDLRRKANALVDTKTEPETDATNPSSWRRPNLDRLKASIREDWKTSKAAPATAAIEKAPELASEVATTDVGVADEKTSPLRAEAENFASLFGDDSETKNDDETVSFFSEGLGSSASSDRTKFSDLRSTIEKTADITPSELLEKRRAELPSREDAMRRIKALRESVKAS